jgi:hypothetical protein
MPVPGTQCVFSWSIDQLSCNIVCTAEDFFNKKIMGDDSAHQQVGSHLNQIIIKSSCSDIIIGRTVSGPVVLAVAYWTTAYSWRHRHQVQQHQASLLAWMHNRFSAFRVVCYAYETTSLPQDKEARQGFDNHSRFVRRFRGTTPRNGCSLCTVWHAAATIHLLCNRMLHFSKRRCSSVPPAAQWAGKGPQR